jgi:integrase
MCWLTIRHGKGDKRRKAKVPVDVMRAISEYLEATGRKEARNTAPLFIGFRKGKGQSKHVAPGAATVVVEGGIALSYKAIEKIVKGYAASSGITGLTPHGLRASFITLALENGAKLQQVQYAAGHADPRTTERYQKRKFNLDDNAVAYDHL